MWGVPCLFTHVQCEILLPKEPKPKGPGSSNPKPRMVTAFVEIGWPALKKGLLFEQTKPQLHEDDVAPVAWQGLGLDSLKLWRIEWKRRCKMKWRLRRYIPA